MAAKLYLSFSQNQLLISKTHSIYSNPISKMRKSFFSLLAILTFISCVNAQNPARALVDDMVTSMNSINNLSGRIKRRERVDGKMLAGDLRFKLMTRPYKLYVYNFAPDEGAELLFVKGWNNDKVLVHPNKFPWINISLNKHSEELTKNGHHPLTAIGFEYTNEVVKHLLKEHADDFDKFVTYKGKENWYGKSMDVIKITYDDYKFVNYTVVGSENLFDIDAKLKVPAYKILELNKSVKNFLDVKAGQVIKVPNVYAKEMVIMIDPDNHLPVVQLIFDEKGLFEKYEYSEVKVNRKFNTNDFLEDNEAYGF